MKTVIYEAVAAINRSFDVVAESLQTLDQQGVLTIEYVQQETEKAEELRDGINRRILNLLQTREADDLDHYGKMRVATEGRLKSS